MKKRSKLIILSLTHLLTHIRARFGVKDTNYINNRLLHSLFLGNVDAEEVVATISDFDEAFASQVNTGFRITTTRKDGMDHYLWYKSFLIYYY